MKRCNLTITIVSKVILFFVLIAATHAQMNGRFEEAWSDLATMYTHSLAEQGMIGSSLVFVHEGSIIARLNYGLADAEEGRLVDERTIFHWGSITKTFTGIAIMQLRDRGLLSIDDPLINYIPELKEVHNPYGSMSDITIRQVMSHTAGFRAPTWPWGGDKPWHPHEPTRWEQLVAMLPYTEILFEPGSTYSYSNPAIIFLGRIIESLSGDDYEVYIDKNILKPLDMYATYFDHTPYHLLKHRSNNYHIVDGKLVANGLDFDTGITTSNSGLNSPLSDMAKYLSFLTSDPERQKEYDAILRRASLEEMWQVQKNIDSNESTTNSIGLVFFVVHHNNMRFIGHTGSQKAFISFFYIHPESRSGCIAAFNTVGRSADGRPAKPYTSELSSSLKAVLFDNIFPVFLKQ